MIARGAGRDVHSNVDCGDLILKDIDPKMQGRGWRVENKNERTSQRSPKGMNTGSRGESDRARRL